MKIKFQRNYRLTIDAKSDDVESGSDRIITIEPPFTLQFDIHRAANAGLNYANLVIYNLNEDTRSAIFQDRYYNPRRRAITLEAGYGDELSTVFKGTIFEATHARRGTDILTLIDARDGGFDVTGTRTFKTITNGVTLQDLIKSLIGDFPNLNEGAVTDFSEGDSIPTMKRPVTISDNTMNALTTYARNADVFIDLEKVYVLKPNEILPGDIQVIDPSTGLLETPRRENSFLSIVTLFEPRIFMAQGIELQSDILPIYNGKYKVIGVNHQGVISEAVGGRCQSTFNLLMDGNLLGEFMQIGTESETSQSP